MRLAEGDNRLISGVFFVAVLKVIQGSSPGQLLELHGERMVLGRHPSCHIVLDNAAVSRTHSQILESHGSYFLEDLRSRNGTLLNGEKIRRREELHEGDEIRVCDLVFTFHLRAPRALSAPAGTSPTSTTLMSPGKAGPGGSSPGKGGDGSGSSGSYVLEPGRPPVSTTPRTTTAGVTTAGVTSAGVTSAGEGRGGQEGRVLDDSLAKVPSGSSSVISKLDISSLRHPRLTVRPEVKLRAILDISAKLARTLKLDEVLPKILETLFNIFPQADRGFVLLKQVDTGNLEVKASRFRREDDRQTAKLSETILEEAMQTGQAILSADAVGDNRFGLSDSVANLRIHSFMCVPLMSSDGDPLGAIQLDSLDIRQHFSQDDLELLASVAAQAALAVDNAHYHAAAISQRDLERDLEFATQVQLGFLPNERPKLDGYEFFDFYEAAQRVGGDFYDYVQLPDGRLCVALGDVAGKGVPAALLMARMYSDARYQLLSRPTPAAAMTGLNRTLASSGLGHRFVTLVFTIIDPRRHVLTIVNAGHMAPLLRNAKGQVSKLASEDSGLPLGISADTVYQQTELPLHSGDTILMFTDGVTEAMNDQGQIFGMKRLIEFFERAPQDVESLGQRLITAVEDFCAGRPQRDDICLTCFRRVDES